MTARIIRLPVRRRGPRLQDNSKVRKALSLLAVVDLYLFKAVLEAVDALDRAR